MLKPEHIEIRNIHTGSMKGNADLIFHQKILPCLSVVQSLHGSYDIEIPGIGMGTTGEGGVFAAPAGKVQKITHHNGIGGYFQAHWLFMDIIVNYHFRAEDLFSFPLLLPEKHNADIAGMLEGLASAPSLCRRYALAYDIADILFSYAEPLPQNDTEKHKLQQYVSENFTQKLHAADLAAALHCSEAQLFRYTRKFFDMSPANYINAVRLQHAARLLEISDLPVHTVALTSGFDDPSYFSKLFKKMFLVSPCEYRLKNNVGVPASSTDKKHGVSF